MRGQRSRKPIGFRLWVVHDIKYTLDDLVDKKYCWYPDDYDIDENIPDIVKVDLLQTALIKLLKNEINDMKEYEEE